METKQVKELNMNTSSEKLNNIEAISIITIVILNKIILMLNEFSLMKNIRVAQGSIIEEDLKLNSFLIRLKI